MGIMYAVSDEPRYALMKLLFDFFPIILFFIAYKITGNNIYIATGVAIVATGAQLAYSRIRHGKIEKLHLVSFVLLLVLGGLTIALQDKRLIMWKVTVVNWLFAVGFLATEFIGDKTLVQRIMEKTIRLPVTVYVKINRAYVGFFVALGFINMYVFMNYSEPAWVNFKLFGMLGLTLLFMLGQIFFLRKYLATMAVTETTDANEEA